VKCNHLLNNIHGDMISRTNFLLYDSFLKKPSRKYYIICALRNFIFEIHVTTKYGNIFLSSVTMCWSRWQRVVRCSQGAQCTTGVRCNRMIMEYTHDEYCDVPLVLGTCSSRAGIAAREYALHYPDTNVFRRLEHRLHETRNVTPTAHVNTGRPRIVRTPTMKMPLP
jgi:hypothetical protein